MNANTKITAKQSKSLMDIVPRQVRFDYSQLNEADYFGGNIVASAFYVALSISFPPGEAEFIKSVKHFECKIDDPVLRKEIRDFAAQEAHHGVQHKQLNKQFERLGYLIEPVAKKIDEKLERRCITWSPAKRLRRTVCAEHFTATMAHQILDDPDSFSATPQIFRDVMMWHAIEEIEHKAVAFDVYKNAVNDMGALRWHYLHFACIEFPFQYWMMTRYLLKQGNFKVTWKDRKEFMKMMFGKGGIYSSVMGHYLSFFSREFHPWNLDNSNLVGRWKNRLSKYFLDLGAGQPKHAS